MAHGHRIPTKQLSTIPKIDGSQAGMSQLSHPPSYLDSSNISLRLHRTRSLPQRADSSMLQCGVLPFAIP